MEPTINLEDIVNEAIARVMDERQTFGLTLPGRDIMEYERRRALRREQFASHMDSQPEGTRVYV